jgi:hypothetical protein
MEKRLIRRERLVPDPKYTISATEENTTIYISGHLLTI